MKNTNGLSKLEKLFTEFIREKRYLANLSEATIRSYYDVWGRWIRFVGHELPTKTNIIEFVVKMREGGLSPVTCNISIRSWNSFMTWLNRNEHCPHFRIKPLKEEKRVMKMLSDEQIRALLA